MRTIITSSVRSVLVAGLLLTGGCGDRTIDFTGGGIRWEVQRSGSTANFVAIGLGVGVASRDLFAESAGISPDKTVVRYNAGVWTPAMFSPGTRCITCKNLRTATVEGITFTVGVGGNVERYDAMTGWVTEATGVKTDLLAVWGSDIEHVWLVGDGGAIVRHDGKRWVQIESPTSQSLRSVWGTSATDIYAVGDQGTIVHHDSTSWTTEQGGTTASLKDVWGTGKDDLFAAGDNGTILHRIP